MYQTPYIDLIALRKNLTFHGGFCEWYYTLWENVLTWPTVAPLTQQLAIEPVLKSGAPWYGPIKVPDNSVGFTEEYKETTAGGFFDMKVEADHIGDSVESRINFQNMCLHKYVIIGKVRAGNYYILIGNPVAGLKLSTKFIQGTGKNQIAKTELLFSQKSRFKAMVLPSFTPVVTAMAFKNDDGSDLLNDDGSVLLN